MEPRSRDITGLRPGNRRRRRREAAASGLPAEKISTRESTRPEPTGYRRDREVHYEATLASFRRDLRDCTGAREDTLRGASGGKAKPPRGVTHLKRYVQKYVRTRTFSSDRSLMDRLPCRVLPPNMIDYWQLH